MANLSLYEQYDAGVHAWAQGDFDLLDKALWKPNSLDLNETRSTAEMLGIKNGWLAAITNLATDPLVWISMLMSRRAPTSALTRDVIPQRFVGAHNEFSGLSYFTRPIQGFFRGTNYAKLIGLRQRREAEVYQKGSQIFKEFGKIQNWERDMPIVSMLMEGQSPHGATPLLRDVATRTRQHMNDMWTQFLGRSWEVEGGFDPSNPRLATARPFTPREAPRWLRDYLPHMPLSGHHSTITVDSTEALRGLTGGLNGQIMQAHQTQLPWGIDGGRRVESHFSQYQDFLNRTNAKIFNPRLYKRQNHNVRLNSATGNDLYVTDLNIIMQKYVHSVARTFANNSPVTDLEKSLIRTRVELPDGTIQVKQATNDPIIVQLINEGLQASTKGQLIVDPSSGRIDPRSFNPMMLRAMTNITRAVRGEKSEASIMFDNMFDRVRFDAVRTNMGPDEQRRTEGALSAMQSNNGTPQIMNNITGYFYASTLGLNFRSAMKNMLQPIITTAPAIGIGPTLKGYVEYGRRLPQYFKAFAKERAALSSNRNMTWSRKTIAAQEHAFEAAFPELAKAGIATDPRLFEQDMERFIPGASTGSGRGLFKDWDAVFRMLLLPFTNVEGANQGVTFYGTKAALRNYNRQGLVDVPNHASGRPLNKLEFEAFLNQEAANTVNSTQFRPGPGSRTMFQGTLPGPLRQFSSFPIRLFNFFSESTVQGAMTQKQWETSSTMQRLLGGRNYSTIARTFLFSRVAEEGARSVLGVDLEGAVGLGGPFNIEPGERKFFPIPIPPVASVAYATASYAATRDMREMQGMTLPFVGDTPIPKVLFPGGVAIQRGTRAIRQFSSNMGGFVDENDRLKYKSGAMGLASAVLGFPLDKDRRYHRAVDIVGNNVRRHKELQRVYTGAAAVGDGPAMVRAQRQYQQEFEGMPPLGTTSDDILKYQQQMRVPALNRFLEVLPEVRRMDYLSQIYETDPELVMFGL